MRIWCRGPLLVALVLVAAALALASCGGGDDEGGQPSNVAELVPADAPVYFQSIANPDSADAAGLGDAINKLLGGDRSLGDRIGELVDQGLSDAGSDLTYDDDIEPWLGDSAGGFISEFSQGSGEGAFLLQTTDSGAAIDALRTGLEESGVKLESAQYEGADYERSNDPGEEGAFGVVEDFLVVGTQTGFERVVDASKGGETIAGSSGFSDAIDAAPADAILTFYASTEQLLKLVETSGDIPKAQLDAVRKQLGAAEGEPVLASLTADASGFAFEGTGPAGAASAAPTPLLDDLPPGSWAAFGIADVGEALKGQLGQLEGAAIPGLTPGSILRQFRAQTGLDLNADLLDWIGDAAFFLSGSSVVDLGVGAVIETTDPDASTRALATAKAAVRRFGASVGPPGAGGAGFSLRIPEFPAPFNVVQEGDRVVIALGDQTTDQALKPSGETLSGSEDFKRAADGLGEGYELSGFLAFGPLVEFATNLGADSEPDFGAAKPYLDRIEYFAVGSKQEGGQSSFKAVLGLR